MMNCDECNGKRVFKKNPNKKEWYCVDCGACKNTLIDWKTRCPNCGHDITNVDNEMEIDE